MLAVFEVYVAPGSDPDTIITPETLRETSARVLEQAVSFDAAYERFPLDCLFHHRWGGRKGPDSIDGRSIVREQVGGRTTAWVPKWQK